MTPPIVWVVRVNRGSSSEVHSGIRAAMYWSTAAPAAVLIDSVRVTEPLIVQ